MPKSKPAKAAARAKAAPRARSKPKIKLKSKSAPAKPVKAAKPPKAGKNDRSMKVDGKKKPGAAKLAAAAKIAEARAAAARASAAKAAAAKAAAKPAHRLNGARAKLNPFLQKQREKLLQLRDSLLDSMSGVAKDTLRARAEGSEASAFGMHQADAGSDAYDRDFALSLLSQEQDALYEIEEAIKRIENGTYGICEMSNKPIAHARLEALPFARYTVECQAQIEKQKRVNRTRAPVTSLFGLTDDEGGEAEEEEATPEAKEEKE
jgi:RNA polymerase-binding transcription factor DksA